MDCMLRHCAGENQKHGSRTRLGTRQEFTETTNNSQFTQTTNNSQFTQTTNWSLHYHTIINSLSFPWNWKGLIYIVFYKNKTLLLIKSPKNDLISRHCRQCNTVQSHCIPIMVQLQRAWHAQCNFSAIVKSANVARRQCNTILIATQFNCDALQ